MAAGDFAAINDTRNIAVVKHVRRADTFFSRLRGLTFRRHLGVDEGLLLVGRSESRAEAAIHMFFVFFSIGVVWLDRENRVVDQVVARPFRPYYAPSGPAIGILECHPDCLGQVAVGDRLRFVPHEGEHAT
jgi:uncharacterized membrane protein (UPF0127 family)